MDMNDAKQARLDARDAFIKELGLQFISRLYIDGGGDVLRFNWPKQNSGAALDRTVMILTWPDGSWSESVDAGRTGIADTVAELRRMVAGY